MADKFRDIKQVTNLIRQEKIYPAFESLSKGVNEPICEISGKKYLMFCSNNYLGLTQNKAVKNAAKKAIEQYGVGPGGSRVISGNVDIIENLETQIAKLTGVEKSLTFPTGYMANIAVFSAMMDSSMGEMFGFQSGDNIPAVIFSDELNHGSIVDGCKLSRAKKVIFKHNDFNDLHQKIKQENIEKKLIVTEGVFSLEGEIVDLPPLLEIVKETNSILMLDDAHGIGVLGENGGGIGEHYHCQKDIDILMGCMDKAMGGTGGYLAGSVELVDYLRIASRSSLLSSAIPTMMAGAMVESIFQIKNDKKNRKQLFEKSDWLRNSLREFGFTILGNSRIPSLPLYIGDEKLGIEFERELQERLIYCKLVRWPAVPLGQSRFRIIVMANHSTKQLEEFSQVCKEIGKKLKIVK